MDMTSDRLGFFVGPQDLRSRVVVDPHQAFVFVQLGDETGERRRGLQRRGCQPTAEYQVVDGPPGPESDHPTGGVVVRPPPSQFEPPIAIHE